MKNPDIPRADRCGGTQSGAAGRSRTGQSDVPTICFAWHTNVSLVPPANRRQHSERVSESTNKGNPMYTDGKTKTAIEPRLLPSLSPGNRPPLMPGCEQIYRRLFVSINPFRAMHIRVSKLYHLKIG